MTHQRWLRLTEWPLTALAVIFLGVYAWSIIGDLGGPAEAAAENLMSVVWVAFTVDYVVQLLLARPRWRWFYTHLPHLAMVVLPALRPLRLLRLFTLWSTLQRTAGNALRGRILVFVVGSSSLLIFIGALGVLDAERGAPGASITTFGDALWWAVVSVTTVGYGDLYPVTTTGRFVAAGLMFGGIALVGVVTAMLASWLVEKVTVKDDLAEERMAAEVGILAAEIRALRAELSSQKEEAEPIKPVNECAAPGVALPT